MKKENVERLVSVLLTPFQKKSIDMNVAVCCKRVFIGTEKPVSCSTCSKTPEVFSSNSLEDTAKIIAAIELQCA